MATLLIVDDDRKLVEFLVGRLSPLGYRCQVETNGERALTLLDESSIDLLILDVMLPGMSGFQVCRRVRANPAHYALPIIFLSAMDSEEEIAHGLSQGADDFLTKPFKVDVLIKHIENLLASSSYSSLNDPVTGLPNAKCIKLAIQNAINEKQGFSIAYLEILRLGEFGRVLGGEARNKALRHFARLLSICAEEFNASAFQAGHLGGGHFVVFIESEHVQEYCRLVARGWEKHLPKLYGDLGQDKAYAALIQRNARGVPVPLLDALICITPHEPASRVTTGQHFEILSHLRQSALEQGSGIFIDRRH